jgi:hypothetical protein
MIFTIEEYLLYIIQILRNLYNNTQQQHIVHNRSSQHTHPMNGYLVFVFYSQQLFFVHFLIGFCLNFQIFSLA